MLFTLKDIQEYKLRAQDGDFGKIKTFLIDDFEWTVRYAVAEIGSRNVLLSVLALDVPDTVNRVLSVNLTRERMMNSPEINFDRPLSRATERQVSDYFEWPYYWDAADVPNTLPGDLTAVPLIDMELDRERQEVGQDQELIPQTGDADQDNFHLRSTKDLFGLAIHTTNDDRNAGKLSDIVAQDEDWQILYLVVDTGGLLSGKKVLLSPTWVEKIDESDVRMDVNLAEATIKDSPAFNSVVDLNDDYQTRLKDYYNR